MAIRGGAHGILGVCLVVSAALQATGAALQRGNRCFEHAEVYPKHEFFVDGIARPVLLDGRPGVNPSADFTNNLVKILAEEVLGYRDVRILDSPIDFHNSTVALQRVSGCTDASCRASLIPNDSPEATANMEVWQDNLLEVALWLETGTIKANGFLGFTARYGWFVSQTLVAQMWEFHQIIADHWKSLYSPLVIGKLYIPLSELRGLVVVKLGPFPTPRSSQQQQQQTGKIRYYCERAECVQGMFIPSACAGVNGTTPTADCSTLIAGYPDTSFDMLIGQILSLHLPVVVAWIGPNWEGYVRGRAQANRPALFLSWSPHTLTSSGLFHRVTLPTCVEGGAVEATSGCDFRAYPISKLTWLPLSYGAPDLDAMITEVSFDDLEMLIVLGKYYQRGGNMADFACEWLRVNKATWSLWVPNKSDPKKTIYLGGLFPDYFPGLSGIGVGAQLAVEAINADDSILTMYELEMVVDGSDGSDAVASYLHLQNDKTKWISGVIGPLRSEDSKVVASIAALYKTVVISYSAESPVLSNHNEYPYFARMIPSAAEDGYTLAQFFDCYNWKRYAVLSDSTVSSLEITIVMEGILEDHGIGLVSSQNFANPLPLNPALFFEDIKAQRAHIILGRFTAAAARVLLCEAFKQDMTGYTGYQWFLPSLYPDAWWDTDYYNSDQYETSESVPCRTHEMALAVAGYMSLSRMYIAQGREPVVGGPTAQQWQGRYRALIEQQGKEASDFAAYAYDAVWTFALAYDSLLRERPGALSVSREERDMSSIMAHLSKIQFPGMTGSVVFDGSDRKGEVLISQHVPQGSKVTMPIARYVPYVSNTSEWTGSLFVNTSDIVWLNDGNIPDDGTMDEVKCAVESFKVFLGVDCQSALAILNAFLIIVIFIILIIFLVLVKKAYDRRVKKAEERVKDLGIIALGQSALLSLDKWEVPRENVVLNRKLGEGAFGTVYGGEAMLTGNQWMGVAVKTLKVESTIEEKLDFLSEAEMMKRFDHRNIVQLLGVCTRREPLYNIMDFMLHGDLKTFLLARRHLVNQPRVDDSSVSPERLTSMVRDVATGVGYLASHKYVHRDLACRNCLVDFSYTVKLADFGMTRATYDSNYYRLNREGKMPVRWMAPESLNEGIFTTKSDIWSMGIVVYEVVTFGGFPYKELSNIEVLDYIRNNRTMRPPADCNPPLAALMQRCWSIEPEERPTANDIVEILSCHGDLIRPSISEPVKSILEEEPAQSLMATPKGTRRDSMLSDGTAMDFGTPNLSRSEKVASLGRRLRASFVRNLSWNSRCSNPLHNMEMADTNRQLSKQPRELESSTQELVPSTLSVITCDTRSSLASLDPSLRASYRSASVQRDSSSSSGVDCNIADSVSVVEMPIGRDKSAIRRSATDSDIIDPTTTMQPPKLQLMGQELNLPCSIAIQLGDELHLLPNNDAPQKAWSMRRSRSRSLGNQRSPRAPKKLLNASYLDPQIAKTSCV